MITKSMFALSLAAIFAMSMIVGLAGQIPFVAADNGETELKAILLDGNGNEVGEAEFEMEDDKSELKVELEGSLADSVFDITIAGIPVGMIATNADGEGEAKWQPSPLVVADGDEITIVDGAGNVLSATFATEDEAEEDEEEDE